MMKFIEGVLAALLLVSHLPAQAEGAKRMFNTEKFVGLASSASASYEEIALEYELENRKGDIVRFTSCTQVETTEANEIVESQYSLFKLLSLNCLALKRYSSSTNAEKSFFPVRLNKTLVAAFPATAMVKLSESDMAKRQGKTLADYEHSLDISIAGDGSAKVITPEDEITYQIMARADFDEDGLEDLLMRVDWRARAAMGRGSDFVLLNRKTKSGPVTVVWSAGGEL